MPGIRQRLGNGDWRSVDQFENKVRTLAMPVNPRLVENIATSPCHVEVLSHEGEGDRAKYEWEPGSELNSVHSILDTDRENFEC